MQAPLSPRQEYVAWVEERVEDFKAGLAREELLTIAEQAVEDLFETEDGQYPLTEILLRDAVDALIFRQLHLPTYRQWLKMCRNDTVNRPDSGTSGAPEDGGTSG
jgi:hypothetical protein